MKKILILIAVLMAPLFMVAQDDEIDELPFDNEPLRDEGRAYFVLAGGLTFDWLMIDEDQLSQFTSIAPEELQLSGPIQLIGGQGVTGIPWVKNLRVGVFGYGGSIESEVLETPGTDLQFNEPITIGTQTNLTASMFGFSLHYGYVPFEHFAILGGVNAGWGDVTFETYRGNITNERPMANVSSETQRYEKNFFFAMPNIQFEYALANFIILRADASYNLTFAQDEKWTYNTLGESSIVPDFDLSGLKVGFGVMIGLVNF
ncbi:MAG: hypothetical protein ACE364_09160 [Chlorobiota bacterium]